MEQSGLFQFSIDNAMEIIMIFDDSGTILYANQTAREKTEYYDELSGSLITRIFPEEFQLDNGGLSYTCKMDGTVQNMMVYRKNKTCFLVKAKLFIHKEETTRFTAPGMRFDDLPLYSGQQTYVCTAYDASKEEFLEKRVSNADREAEDALKVKSEFVANVTHELRTPMNGILGNTQELLELETQKDKLKLLQMIERGCRDMNAIINNVLDFSKLEAGKFTLELRKFEFRNMIDYVKSNHSSNITEKGLDFSVTVSPEMPKYIIADELRIVQILNNLISNAYKFTLVGSIHVEIVKTAQVGERVELFFMVMDTGIGIAKADQDKLFKSFSQVDASISRKYGGTGLGLNICKQLVELMGGNIHVESEVGKGTTFSFQIWVEIPEEEKLSESSEGNQENNQSTVFVSEYKTDLQSKGLIEKLQNLTEDHATEGVWEYGTVENSAELKKMMSKLILSVEMDNWEKGEMFAETVKQLVEGAPREVKSAALRMKMAVQKGDYEKAVAAFELLEKSL